MSREEIRDLILNDHFGGDMPPQIVDQWVSAVLPGSQHTLPPNTKGFYGCSLRPSLPIEIARGSYKHITHETQDVQKIEKYARRMLTALDLLDLETLESDEPTLACLGLWHRALAEVRLQGETQCLEKTLERYLRTRPKSPLPDNKLPGPLRLAESLRGVAMSLGNEAALGAIDVLDGKGRAGVER